VVVCLIAAYGGKAELTRYRVADGETRRTDLVEIDLAGALRGDPKDNLTLEPFDILSVKEVSQWHSLESVTLAGEVRFPAAMTSNAAKHSSLSWRARAV